jgi:rfaE bifunctional protein nucleotidyltransferase chain/domain
MTKVIVNGTFDILHKGHLKMLEHARSLGDQVLVCIDSDSRVKELKGDSRPINNQYDRAFMLASLRYVDMVWTFESDENLINQIKLYQPDIMVKGSDWKDKLIVGEEFCGRIEFFERIYGYSTTETIQHIVDR